ncbi:MAG: DUF2752 domain-containing protein [Pirellulales bacterium]
MTRRARCLAALVGLGLLGTLVLASQLRPDARGWGTHQQLGLPPCTLFVVAGVRCPACGMTTSWSYATRGQMAAALRTHVGGTLLAVAAALIGVAALVVAASGKWLLRLPGETAIIVVIVLAVAAMLGEWIVRLAAG